jgi:glycosyltransferase involved in cell wall biosynthesis
VRDGAAAIMAEGFALHPIPFRRGRFSLRAVLATIFALRRIHRGIAPAVVHHVALQTAVLGSLAAIGRPVACINAVTGLGHAFIAQSLRARLVRPLVGRLLRMLLDRPNTVALVQNPDDREALLAQGIAGGRIALIPGSGVDVDQLRPMALPDGPVTLGFAGRLLEDKGIRVLVTAVRELRRRGSEVSLLIAGTPDPANPSSVDAREAQAWSREGGVVLLGHVDDIAALWRRAHIAVLPSRREGLPKALLEAAACGRPMIATDVPGCREVAIADVTGLLVPPDDPPALAQAIERLAAAPDLRAQYGAAARKLAVERFASEVIARDIVALYRRMIGAEHSAADERAPNKDARPAL